MRPYLYKMDKPFFIEYISRNYEWQMPALHFHPSYELFFLEDGERNFFSEEQYFTINQYSVAFFKPNALHKSMGIVNHSRTSIYFTDEFLDKHFTQSAKHTLLKCFEKTTASLSREIFIQLKHIMIRLTDQNLQNPDNIIFVLLSEILSILNAHTNESPSILKKNELVAQIMEYINKNYLSISSISQIADQFLITKYHLCRLFKENTNLTVVTYINMVKIQHACNLLSNTTKSITEIAFECGFNSSMYFCKTFREIVNRTPSEFRSLIKD